ncbi:hypothetical protein QCE49_08600 [Caballeronia sp. LZ008]|uniref:hypothetical protein n=1 Tax=Caballeronia sp. INML5 TaxID=2921750 RepID=UPI00202820DA|nr:hypothetical protein [Caballeronia sp. INML5]MDR5793431.1 hypothetical protein [Caballeronia sp. LZ008]
MPFAACIRPVECPPDSLSTEGTFAPERRKFSAHAAFGNFLLDRPRAPLLHFLTRIISEMSALRRAQEARQSNLDAPLEPEPQARQRAPDQFFAENSKGDE